MCGLIVLALSGCGSRADKWTARRPPIFPATGLVTLNGAAVDDALVAFDSQVHNLTAVGRTNMAGRFILKTYEPGDGAAAGEHRVRISKIEVNAYDAEGYPLGEVNKLPERYADSSGGLQATVKPSDENVFRFELMTDQPAK